MNRLGKVVIVSSNVYQSASSSLVYLFSIDGYNDDDEEKARSHWSTHRAKEQRAEASAATCLLLSSLPLSIHRPISTSFIHRTYPLWPSPDSIGFSDTRLRALRVDSGLFAPRIWTCLTANQCKPREHLNQASSRVNTRPTVHTETTQTTQTTQLPSPGVLGCSWWR